MYVDFGGWVLGNIHVLVMVVDVSIEIYFDYLVSFRGNKINGEDINAWEITNMWASMERHHGEGMH